jgi:protein gp37
MSTAIEWTDVTDQLFTVKGGGWWCRRISEGCDFCYASELNQNDFFGGNHLDYSGDRPEGLILRTDIIDKWAKQTKQKKHFVSSMTDIFGEWVSQDEAFRFLDGMLAASRQIFQMLTKRPHVAKRHIDPWLTKVGLRELPAHMWIGTSVENQKWADIRIPQLLNIPAKVRFLSCEPLLGPVKLENYLLPTLQDVRTIYRGENPDYPRIHWVISGGESGKNARRSEIVWHRSIINQCKAAGVACFMKQLGGNLGDADLSECSRAVGKSMAHPKGGDIAEWCEDLRVREFPNQPILA